jgi:hypothetical protein
MGQKPRNDLKELRLVLNAAEEKAQSFIKEIGDLQLSGRFSECGQYDLAES